MADVAFHGTSVAEPLQKAIYHLVYLDQVARNLDPKVYDTEGRLLDADTNELCRKTFYKLAAIESARSSFIDFGVKHFGISTMHPVLDPLQWKPPYGMNIAEPTINPLRLSAKELLKDDESILWNFTNHINKVQIHKHRHNNCLKEVSKKELAKGKEKEKKDGSLEPGQLLIDGKVYKCRYGYEKPVLGYKETFVDGQKGQILKEVSRKHINDNPNAPVVVADGAEIIVAKKTPTAIEFLRNHKMINEHVPEIALLWRANCDTKVILHQKQLEEYISKYIGKAEKSSSDYHATTKATIAEANENSTARATLQRALIRSTTRDVSRQESALLLHRKHELTNCSLKFKHVSLIGENKLVNVDADDVNRKLSDNQNMAQTYWAREQDENYHTAVQKFQNDREAYVKSFSPKWKSPKDPQQVCLHEFISFFDKNWRGSSDEYVPLCSPFFTKPPPNIKKAHTAYELFCKASILEFKPGANPKNLLDGTFSFYRQAARKFAFSTDMPPNVYEDYKAKKHELSEFCREIIYALKPGADYVNTAMDLEECLEEAEEWIKTTNSDLEEEFLIARDDFDEYCKELILAHKPEATEENALQKYDSISEVMYDYVSEDNSCPSFIKEDYTKANSAKEKDEDDDEDKAEDEDEENEDEDGDTLENEFQDLHEAPDGELYLVITKTKKIFTIYLFFTINFS